MHRASEMAFQDSNSNEEDFQVQRFIGVGEDFTMKFRFSKDSVFFVLDQIEIRLE